MSPNRDKLAPYPLKGANLKSFTDKVSVPSYDRSEIKEGIVHVGIGGFHRSHQAYYIDQLLNNGAGKDWGICGVSLLEHDAKIHKTLTNQEGLYTLVVKQPDGTCINRVIGSIIGYLYAPENPQAVIDKMAAEDIKIITLTITEGGYNFNEATNSFDFENPLIKHDLANPQNPKTIFGYLTEAFKKRKSLGHAGVTIHSCDNILGNGKMAKKMLESFIQEADPTLLSWVESNVSFPNSMVDRITPVTKQEDIDQLKATTGIEDQWPVVCEPFRQWIIEDNFVAGRPELERLTNEGIQYVENVEAYERMKLSLLNAGHSVIGILGALLGYSTIDQAVKDLNISVFLRKFMDIEVTPILGEIKGINLEEYKNSLLERFGNANIKDQVERICSESSSKLPVFVFPTVISQIKKNGSISMSAFLIAAWAVYLLGKNENGEPISIQDANKNMLTERANQSTKDPKYFLGLTAVFGSLNSYPMFVDTYTAAYNAIVQNGVAKAVEMVNSGSFLPTSITK